VQTSADLTEKAPSAHGDFDDVGGVYVVGSDGRRHRRTRVEDWCIQVAADPGAPTTLFLPDLCHAGAVNRHWQPPKGDRDQRAWVIAAAGADQPAYAGRLTRAAAAVIEELTSGRTDLDPTLRWVAFDMLFERIRLRMGRLALDEGGYEQDPVCTPVMGAQPQLRFFANPGYRPTPVGEAAALVEPATARFVDPVLDEEHFRDRAAGRGPARDRIGGGGFAGRAPQLRRLAGWMDGDDDPHAAGGLVVVTGSPGVGKSALLGVLVCAAHPQLREPTRELWRAAAARPSENADLAAVHARQRGLAEITDSLGRQLLGSDGALYPGPDLYPGEDVVPAGARTPDELIAAIARCPSPPVIVLDALDEALGAGQILERLLIPLAQARRSDGSPVCRLLVGTRPWSEFAPLFDFARQTGEVRCHVTLRTLARAMLDRTYFMPAGEQSAAYTSAQRAALGSVLADAGAAVAAVAPIASVATAPDDAAAARRAVETHLAALDVHRARLADLLAVDPAVDQAAWSQHGSLLGAVDRLRVEAPRPPGRPRCQSVPNRHSPGRCAAGSTRSRRPRAWTDPHLNERPVVRTFRTPDNTSADAGGDPRLGDEGCVAAGRPDPRRRVGRSRDHRQLPSTRAHRHRLGEPGAGGVRAASMLCGRWNHPDEAVTSSRPHGWAVPGHVWTCAAGPLRCAPCVPR
jgi:hypothetical protein